MNGELGAVNRFHLAGNEARPHALATHHEAAVCRAAHDGFSLVLAFACWLAANHDEIAGLEVAELRQLLLFAIFGLVADLHLDRLPVERLQRDRIAADLADRAGGAAHAHLAAFSARSARLALR